MKNYFITVILFLVMLMLSCQDELDIINPNKPSPEDAKTEIGIIGLAQGAVYINGLGNTKFGGSLPGGVWVMHELMGDVVTASDAGGGSHCPDSITLDNGNSIPSINLDGQIAYLRAFNIPSSQDNTFFFEWAIMYSLNGALNKVLANVASIDMNENKKNTIRAWCYFWKGYAYSRIGSMYYAGIITNELDDQNNLYVTKEKILEEAEKYFALAEELLLVLNDHPDYLSTMDKLVPSICKPGKGGIMTVGEWIRHIHTFRARNILVNTQNKQLTAEQWNTVLSLTTSGIKATDNTFTLRSDETSQLLSIYDYVASGAYGPASDGGGWLKISERLIQEFKVGDNRLTNNFMEISPWIDPQRDRATNTNTRYVLVDQGNGMPGVMVYLDRDVGEQELYLSCTYEENILMQAEANINIGNIDAGLVLLDELRDYQGAGLSALGGTGLTIEAAKEELRRERRVALAFRGLSFYDARRWGFLENARTGCTVIDFNGVVSTNARIYYGFLDYWDVPVAEWYYNPAGPGSADIVNPRGN